MKNIILLIALVVVGNVSAQKKQPKKLNPPLRNAVVLAQMDSQEDRYSTEVCLTNIFGGFGIKAKPSLNIIKRGEDAVEILSEENQAKLTADGFDTYVVVRVLGYDRKYTATNLNDDLKTTLGLGAFYGLFRPEMTNITFEFKIFRNGKIQRVDVKKIGNIGNRDDVLRKLSKTIVRLLEKSWKA